MCVRTWPVCVALNKVEPVAVKLLGAFIFLLGVSSQHGDLFRRQGRFKHRKPSGNGSLMIL